MKNQRIKIALICPSNKLLSPYVENYLKILTDSENVKIISWNRLNLNEEVDYSFEDDKNGESRNFFEYLMYVRYVIKIMKEEKFDKVIIFGVQLAFFLNRILLKNYKGKFIIDVRDYHKLIKLMNFTKLIRQSHNTIISSAGYKDWLMASDKILVNHNFNISEIIENNSNLEFKYPLIIANIGAIRDENINIKLIESLKNKAKFRLEFHGRSEIASKIEDKYLFSNVKNLIFTGIYSRNQEEELYKNADFINVFRENDSINNFTALPNRLYKAVYYYKPLIALKGTYVSKLIAKYDIGLVVDDLENLDLQIEKYIQGFNWVNYKENRLNFLNDVISENDKFEKVIENFSGSL